jgi:N-methylhydantoinase A
VLQGFQRFAVSEDTLIVHGSTVATNAVLERKGARTAFITTKGFKDLLRIGRQNRTELYEFAASRPPPLIPLELSFELAERVDREGRVLETLDDDDIAGLAKQLRREAVESVAICFFFSFLHPEHEQRVGRALTEAGFSVSVSSEIHPEFREYERASTTALNAYVMPVMDRYLRRLAEGLPSNQLRIMNSNGGSLSTAQAREQPAKAILSGPAAGVVGALHVAQMTGLDRIISFDMGGTSTDVSLAMSEPQLTSEGEIAGLPLRVPMIDIHTVGSGGGSIAYVDPGGLLQVGPESAGADPGPACYGNGGTEPTVTDANLLLGRLDPERFLGGEMILDSAAASQVINGLAQGLDMASEEAALGVVKIVNAQMARAIRLVSVARGHDPRDFTLISFGGAGGLHACEVARLVGIDRVLIPRGASTLSAYGMLAADVAKDFVRTVMLPPETQFKTLDKALEPMVEAGRADIKSHGIPPERIELVRELGLRYVGQSYELQIPFESEFRQAFHERHQEAYGYSDPDVPIEVVNLRVRAIGRVQQPGFDRKSLGSEDPADALISKTDGALTFFEGDRLTPGNRIPGPSIILFPDTTAYLGGTDSAKVDAYGNLLVEVGHK